MFVVLTDTELDLYRAGTGERNAQGHLTPKGQGGTFVTTVDLSDPANFYRNLNSHIGDGIITSTHRKDAKYVYEIEVPVNQLGADETDKYLAARGTIFNIPEKNDAKIIRKWELSWIYDNPATPMRIDTPVLKEVPLDKPRVALPSASADLPVVPPNHSDLPVVPPSHPDPGSTKVVPPVHELPPPVLPSHPLPQPPDALPPAPTLPSQPPSQPPNTLPPSGGTDSIPFRPGAIAPGEIPSVKPPNVLPAPIEIRPIPAPAGAGRSKTGEPASNQFVAWGHRSRGHR